MMLATSLVRKVSKLHDELEGLYQEMRAEKRTAVQFSIGEAADCLRLAMMAMENAKRKVA